MLASDAIPELAEPQFLQDVLAEMLIFETQRKAQERLPGNHFGKKNRCKQASEICIEFLRRILGPREIR